MKAIRIPTDDELGRILNEDQHVINLPRHEPVPCRNWIVLVNPQDEAVGLVRVESTSEAIYAELPWMAADWIWLINMPRYFIDPIPAAGSRNYHVFELRAIDDDTLEKSVFTSLGSQDYHAKNRQQAISHQMAMDHKLGLGVPDSFEGHRQRR